MITLTPYTIFERVQPAAAKLRLSYIRFMDDILILAPTRWQLRGAVKVVNQALGALRLEKHPDKTFIGRIERGFDFLGYHFGPAGLTVAKQTIANFIEKASRLYGKGGGLFQPPLRLRCMSGAGSVGPRAGCDESLRKS